MIAEALARKPQRSKHHQHWTLLAFSDKLFQLCSKATRRFRIRVRWTHALLTTTNQSPTKNGLSILWRGKSLATCSRFRQHQSLLSWFPENQMNIRLRLLGQRKMMMMNMMAVNLMMMSRSAQPLVQASKWWCQNVSKCTHQFWFLLALDFCRSKATCYCCESKGKKEETSRWRSKGCKWIAGRHKDSDDTQYCWLRLVVLLLFHLEAFQENASPKPPKLAAKAKASPKKKKTKDQVATKDWCWFSV